MIKVAKSSSKIAKILPCSVYLKLSVTLMDIVYSRWKTWMPSWLWRTVKFVRSVPSSKNRFLSIHLFLRSYFFQLWLRSLGIVQIFKNFKIVSRVHIIPSDQSQMLIDIRGRNKPCCYCKQLEVESQVVEKIPYCRMFTARECLFFCIS